MTEFKKNGLVIQERDLGENDKLLTVLTEKYGKVYVVAKGAKSVRNRHMASTQLFSYATFGLRKKGNYYYITETDLIESYYEIRTDIVKLSLATYVCDVVNYIVQEGNGEDAILKLTLNTFFAIAKNVKPLDQIKSSFELRISMEAGFTPNLESCSTCETHDVGLAYFDIIDGVIYCEKCKNKLFYASAENEFLDRGLAKPIEIISSSVLTAMRYVVSCRPERFLSYILKDDEQSAFNNVCEKFLLNQLEDGFYSLDFYKSIK